jgi:hypothetical protein
MSVTTQHESAHRPVAIRCGNLLDIGRGEVRVDRIVHVLDGRLTDSALVAESGTFR